MKKILFITLIISMVLSEQNSRNLQPVPYQRDNHCSCEEGFVPDCSGDDDCCSELWIGDGYQDCEEQEWGCDLTCYGNDWGDCGDIPNQWYQFNYYCEPGTVPDCSGDGDCCDASWIDDTICDGEDQDRGCDLECYYEDGFDCDLGSPGSMVANLAIDCEWCAMAFSVGVGDFTCFEILNIGWDPYLDGTQYNCYVCEESYDCYGTCLGGGPQASETCCDGTPSCYDCDCDVFFDGCGLCGGDSNGPNTGVQDCAGVCWGDAEVDCNDVCNGGAVVDECGICEGPGILDGECDCSGNILDSCGVCGGDNLADAGCGCFEPPPNENGECECNESDCNNDGIDDACEDEFDLGALTGDANGDGILNIVDLVIFVNMILNNN